MLVEEAVPVDEICALEHKLHIDLHAGNVERAALHRIEDEVSFSRDDIHSTLGCLIPGENPKDRHSRIEKRNDLVEPFFLSRCTRARHKDDQASETNSTPKRGFHCDGHQGEDYQHGLAESKMAREHQLNYTSA